MSSYEMGLPAGWSRLPLDEHGLSKLDRLLDATFAGRSRDEVAQTRHELRAFVVRQMEAAAAVYGVDIYLPAASWRRGALPASLVVAHVPSTAMASTDGMTEHEEALRVLAAMGSGAQEPVPVAVDGVPALRFTEMELSSPKEGAKVLTRRIDYLAPHDGWLVFSWTHAAEEAGSTFDLALTELCDAMISTVSLVPHA